MLKKRVSRYSQRELSRTALLLSPRRRAARTTRTPPRCAVASFQHALRRTYSPHHRHYCTVESLQYRVLMNSGSATATPKMRMRQSLRLIRVASFFARALHLSWGSAWKSSSLPQTTTGSFACRDMWLRSSRNQPTGVHLFTTRTLGLAKEPWTFRSAVANMAWTWTTGNQSLD